MPDRGIVGYPLWVKGANQKYLYCGHFVNYHNYLPTEELVGGGVACRSIGPGGINVCISLCPVGAIYRQIFVVRHTAQQGVAIGNFAP